MWGLEAMNNFSIRDRVYLYEKKLVLNTNCNFCLGAGKLLLKGHNSEVLYVKCPKCEGKGASTSRENPKRWSSKNYYTTRTTYRSTKSGLPYENVKFFVEGINIYTDSEGSDITYTLTVVSEDEENLGSFDAKEDKMFVSKQECELFCMKMNEMEFFD